MKARSCSLINFIQQINAWLWNCRFCGDNSISHCLLVFEIDQYFSRCCACSNEPRSKIFNCNVIFFISHWRIERSNLRNIIIQKLACKSTYVINDLRTIFTCPGSVVYSFELVSMSKYTNSMFWLEIL